MNDNKITNDAIGLAHKDFSKNVLWLAQDHIGVKMGNYVLVTLLASMLFSRLDLE